MNTRELILFRHAKSAWDLPTATDFERPLATRGRKGAKTIGRWVLEQGLLPDVIISSDATRAQQTLSIFLSAAQAEAIPVQWQHAIYMAGLLELLEVLAAAPNAPRVMLVGHNPGMEGLVCHLSDDQQRFTGSPNIMPTAAFARLELPHDWSTLPPGCGRLLSITCPKDLPEG